MRKILKVFSVAIAPIVSILTFITGCFNFGKRVDVDNKGIMQDINEAPDMQPAYEQYSRQALEDYYAIANNYKDGDGEIDIENEEVIKAANTAAAKLYAYACYNERTLDRYAFFSNQTGTTDLGSTGKGEAVRQEYYLRVNESENTCGYRFHYTIKKVNNSSGTLKTIKGLFESARIRLTDKTDLLYRFEGDTNTIAYSEEEHNTLGCNLLNCDWQTGKDWGKPDIRMVKSEFIEPDKIEEDIIDNAGEDNITIRGNINILAENIVKSATIIGDEAVGYTIVMQLDTDVANSDEASLKMIRKANGSDDCSWVDDDLVIVFRLWGNGLFRFYQISEHWSGKISGFTGTVDSVTAYNYSYSERDCDMSANLEMLARANAAKNG